MNAQTDQTLEPPRSRVGLRLLIAGVRASASIDLAPPGSWTLGRKGDLEIDEASISRQHARLSIDLDVAGHWRILVEDLGSTNGTMVRGRSLAAGEKAPVSLGEAIDLGGVVVVVQRPRAGEKKEQARDVVVEDPAMKEVHRLAGQVAATDIPVLILGETGVGKELVAEAIHHHSRRASGPLVRLNCAALSSSLLESELFGHERGAFTGAVDAKRGLLESAAGGTVLLDEVGELPLEIQPKLLRALEEGSVLRLGALTPVSIDVRFIAATNRDLEADVEVGRFRRDLFYRLSGFVIDVPPLRQRRAEILSIAAAFSSVEIGEDARAFLLSHDWPGNVRELRNAMRRAELLAGAGPIMRTHLALRTAAKRAPSGADTLPPLPPQEEAERARVIDALDRCIGNQTRAAEMLGMSRRRLIDRIEKFNLPRPRKR